MVEGGNFANLVSRMARKSPSCENSMETPSCLRRFMSEITRISWPTWSVDCVSHWSSICFKAASAFWALSNQSWRSGLACRCLFKDSSAAAVFRMPSTGVA